MELKLTCANSERTMAMTGIAVHLRMEKTVWKRYFSGRSTRLQHAANNWNKEILTHA